MVLGVFTAGRNGCGTAAWRGWQLSVNKRFVLCLDQRRKSLDVWRTVGNGEKVGLMMQMEITIIAAIMRSE